MVRGKVEQLSRGKRDRSLVRRDDVGAALERRPHMVDRGLSLLDVEHRCFDHDDRASWSVRLASWIACRMNSVEEG